MHGLPEHFVMRSCQEDSPSKLRNIEALILFSTPTANTSGADNTFRAAASTPVRLQMIGSAQGRALRSRRSCAGIFMSFNQLERRDECSALSPKDGS